MADLRTILGGLELKNPVIASSSELTMTEAGIRACVDAGVGAVVAKSINELPAAAEQLRIADYAILDDDLRRVPWGSGSGVSLFNRSGLAGGGLDAWLRLLASAQAYASDRGSLVIGSVTVAGKEPAAELAAAMAAVVPAIEINVGAPHGREGTAVRQVAEADQVAAYTARVRAAIDCPLIVKLPGQASDVVGMAQAAAAEGADMVSMIGRFNGFVPDLETWDPTLGSWGAIGGSWALPISLYWISKCHRAIEPPLIGTNGARTGLDVARFLLAGASAVEIASALLMHGPDEARRIIDQLMGYLDERGVSSVRDLIGVTERRSRTYAELSPAAEPPRPWAPYLDEVTSRTPAPAAPPAP